MASKPLPAASSVTPFWRTEPDTLDNHRSTATIEAAVALAALESAHVPARQSTAVYASVEEAKKVSGVKAAKGARVFKTTPARLESKENAILAASYYTAGMVEQVVISATTQYMFYK
ncbi:hypothetical protein BDW62DRAFT_203471 [Aspergillus aurantiobrunneus]